MSLFPKRECAITYRKCAIFVVKTFHGFALKKLFFFSSCYTHIVYVSIKRYGIVITTILP